MTRGLTCQSCGDPGYLLPVVELRALLCLDCDLRFAGWRGNWPWAAATDWPGWVGGAR